MSYLFEGQRIITPFTINSNQPQFQADTVSLKRLVATQEAQRWELSFGLEPTRDGGDLLSALTFGATVVNSMVIPQVLKTDTTLIVDDDVPTATGTAGDVTITVAVEAGDNENKFTTGTFIKFANHDKVYILTADATVASGAAELNIYPSLLFDVPALTIFQHQDDVDLTYRMDDSTVKGINFVDGLVAQVGQINIVEAL